MPFGFSERELILRALRGERLKILPWATRLDIWYNARSRAGSLPSDFAGLDLMDIHQRLGVGRQSYVTLVKTRLRRVELSVALNGNLVKRISDPCLRFPKPREMVPLHEPGETVFTFRTPVGCCELRYRTNEEVLRSSVRPYLVKHILHSEEDFEAVLWILDHLEVVPDYAAFAAREAEIGREGFTVGMMDRVPYQRLVLDFMGEEHAFYEMVDNPRRFKYLLDILTVHAKETMRLALGSPALLVEFADNFDGMITSPRLFQEYCMPFMQEAADYMHGQGRFLGSHMDGNLKPLLHLIPESGLDVVESFSPAPLSPLSFAEAWEAWSGRVLIWGGIPSPLFEAHVPVWQLEDCVRDILDRVGDEGRIILGIADQAMGPTEAERVSRVSRMLGRRPSWPSGEAIA